VFTKVEARNAKKIGLQATLKIIPGGVDLKVFSRLPSSTEFERTYPELRDKKVILFLGRLHKVKGLDLLTRAFGRIHREGLDDVWLVIAGPNEGGYRTQVERGLREEGVLDRTTFTGMITGKEKLSALARCDLFVLPSYSEGFSVALLEALASGCPVVITNRCNFPEVAQAEAGLVIEPHVEDLTNALIKLLRNNALRLRMGQNARAMIEDGYSWGKIGNQFEEFYTECLLRSS